MNRNGDCGPTALLGKRDLSECPGSSEAELRSIGNKAAPNLVLCRLRPRSQYSVSLYICCPLNVLLMSVLYHYCGALPLRCRAPVSINSPQDILSIVLWYPDDKLTCEDLFASKMLGKFAGIRNCTRDLPLKHRS